MTKQNDIQPNDNQHNDIDHNDLNCYSQYQRRSAQSYDEFGILYCYAVCGISYCYAGCGIYIVMQCVLEP